MTRRAKSTKRHIESYAHAEKERVNNPSIGLVTPDTDLFAQLGLHAHGPHIDPQLTWAGKAEHTSFDVPTVSLHVHERNDPRTIIEATRKRTRPHVFRTDRVREPIDATEPTRVVVSFGPDHAPTEQRQVALAIEARSLVPRPKLTVFAAFQVDPEAAKDIDETRWPGSRCSRHR